MYQRQAVKRFSSGETRAPGAASSIARGVRAAAVVAIAGLVITACTSKADGGNAGGGEFVDEELAAALQEEGPIDFIDHAWLSSIIQAQLLSQVFQEFGAETTNTRTRNRISRSPRQEN